MSSTGAGVSIPIEAVVPVDRFNVLVLGTGAASGGFPAGPGSGALTNDEVVPEPALTDASADCVEIALGTEVLSPPQPGR